MRKGQVVSIRIPEEIGENFDDIAKYLSLNKTEFLTECIKKLVNNNKIIIKNYYVIERLIEKIRNEIKKISTNYIRTLNGHIKFITIMSTYSFCDFLFANSEEFWKIAKEIANEWDIKIINNGKDVLENYTEEFIFEIGDISLLMQPMSTSLRADDLISGENWLDDLEAKKIILLLAANELIEKTPLNSILSDIIRTENKKTNNNNYLIIDVNGGFRRGRNTLFGPVYFDTVENWKKSEFCYSIDNPNYKNLYVISDDIFVNKEIMKEMKDNDKKEKS